MNMYFLALVAPEAIDQKVLKWKLWIKERYGCEVALRAPAHITLVPPFWMQPSLEAAMMDAIMKFSASRLDFRLCLNNFSHFGSRVIFIDVAPENGLTNLQKELFDFLARDSKFPLKEDDRPFHPHVTIATRDLYKKAFAEAWEHFKEKKYSAEWLVKGISLLRHDDTHWEVLATASIG
jgi:2'-5' RNA ligase